MHGEKTLSFIVLVVKKKVVGGRNKFHAPKTGGLKEREA